ncbi:hypothetical protein [Mycobacterium malmoense]|uniref:hypothetical protein n=1 Tax=Mycobacterium malmoense TaxID=1780 RepID=UPI0008F86342|nr:hypothetical protein [Mycobacterium malmoense]OIN79095.1 hypothetical protein BMG05_19830 [Mycobacterium malmoense]
MSSTRIQELRLRQQRVWDEANAIVHGADVMCRDLNSSESAAFQAKTEEFNRLGAQLRTMEDAQPGGRDPHAALAELAEVRYGPKRTVLHQEILAIQKRLGERTAESIIRHDASLRDRQLAGIAADMQREEREAERRRVLEHQKRMGQLTAQLDGGLAVERDEARQRQANEN